MCGNLHEEQEVERYSVDIQPIGHGEQVSESIFLAKVPGGQSWQFAPSPPVPAPHDGTDVGCEEGLVGDCVGVEVGYAEVGEKVGKGDGIGVGTKVGANVGDADGFADGTAKS